MKSRKVNSKTVFLSINNNNLLRQPVADLQKADSNLYENNTYWYRKTFTVDHSKSDIVKLKINKAKYHTKVFLNNHLAGENSYCFTPAVFDIKSLLKDSGEDNILLIAVGCKNNLPDTVVGGDDFEKTKYIPGIYDDVKLILTNAPFIRNIQAAPDIEKEELHIVAGIETINPNQKAISQALLDKHYLRKHGKDAYYGQK